MRQCPWPGHNEASHRVALTVHYAADRGRGFTLYANSPNRFYLTFPEAQATFSTNASGQATALTWNQGGASTTYSKRRLPTRLITRRIASGFEVRLEGDTDREFVIETSPDLQHWSPFATNTLWDAPIAVAPESVTTGPSPRFFRARDR